MLHTFTRLAEGNCYSVAACQFPAYPDGQDDNTHFQPEGAVEAARLVYEGLKDIATTH